MAIKLRLIYTSALMFVKTFIYLPGHRVTSCKSYKYREFVNLDHNRSKMLKGHIFGIVLIALIASGCVQSNQQLNEFFTLTHFEDAFHQIINNLISNLNTTEMWNPILKKRKTEANAISNIWQMNNQQVLLNETNKVTNAYDEYVKINDHKIFNKCNDIKNKIISLSNTIGNDLYVCHEYYIHFVEYYINQIENTAGKKERETLDRLYASSCGSKEAKTPQAKLDAAGCLMVKVIELFNRRNTDTELFYYTQQLSVLNQYDYIHLNACPGNIKLELYLNGILPALSRELNNCKDTAMIECDETGDYSLESD
ncbi:uncharacterized protein [Venturia canescens]|uniref:uncharacterized protein n=1 Tax=Venturia canescens TaxID=32260 RepID=UPI001C9D2C05|nr:uncharacterized protein LOC122410656 [Venturia canescens]